MCFSNGIQRGDWSRLISRGSLFHSFGARGGEWGFGWKALNASDVDPRPELQTPASFAYRHDSSESFCWCDIGSSSNHNLVLLLYKFNLFTWSFCLQGCFKGLWVPRGERDRGGPSTCASCMNLIDRREITETQLFVRLFKFFPVVLFLMNLVPNSQSMQQGPSPARSRSFFSFFVLTCHSTVWSTWRGTRRCSSRHRDGWWSPSLPELLLHTQRAAFSHAASRGSLTW